MRTALLALLVPAMLLAVDEDGRFERTLSVSGPVSLDITNDSGRISVQAGTSSQVVIRATLRAHRGSFDREGALQRIRNIEANPPIEQSGNTIRIGYFHERNADRGVSITYEISTPPNTSLKSRNDSGGSSVSGIDGPVDVSSDSGGVEVSQIRNDVHVKADSGGIEISDVEGSVIANADSGGIRAMNVGGALDLSTDSGGIRFSQTRAAPIKAHADSGGITAKLAPNAGYDLDLASDSGNVSSEGPITVSGSMSRHRMHGKIGAGGPLVDLRTDSGNVRIE